MAINITKKLRRVSSLAHKRLSLFRPSGWHHIFKRSSKHSPEDTPNHDIERGVPTQNKQPKSKDAAEESQPAYQGPCLLLELPNELLYHIISLCDLSSCIKLCLAHRRFIAIAQPRIWSNITIHSENGLARFLCALEDNAHFGKVVRSFQCYWKGTDPRPPYSSENKATMGKKLPQPILELLPNLHSLRICRPRPCRDYREIKWHEDLGCITSLRELDLDGFVYTPRTVKGLSAFEGLRHIVFRWGLFPSDWKGVHELQCNTSVTWLTLGASHYPIGEEESGRRPMYTEFPAVSCELVVNVMSRFCSLTKVDLIIKPEDMEHAKLVSALDWMQNNFRLSSLKLETTFPPAVDCHHPDFSSWAYLEELAIDSVALWPSAHNWEERCDLPSKLPRSLKYLKISFPYIVKDWFKVHKANGIVQINSDKEGDSREDIIFKSRFDWLASLADAISNHSETSLPALPVLRKLEFIEDACYHKSWREQPMKHTVVELPSETKTGFEERGVDVCLMARAYEACVVGDWLVRPT